MSLLTNINALNHS